MKHTPFFRLIRTPFLQGFLFLVFLVSCLLSPTLTVHAYLQSGESAIDVLGQFGTDGVTPLFTKDGDNNGPNAFGFKLNATATTAIDTVHHRFFITDYGNNRVLVFNLNTDNTFMDFIVPAVGGINPRL